MPLLSPPSYIKEKTKDNVHDLLSWLEKACQSNWERKEKENGDKSRVRRYVEGVAEQADKSTLVASGFKSYI